MGAQMHAQQGQQVNAEEEAQVGEAEHVRHPEESKTAGKIDEVLEGDQPQGDDHPRPREHRGKEPERHARHRADRRDADGAVGHERLRHKGRAEPSARKVPPGVHHIGEDMRKVGGGLDEFGGLDLHDGVQAEHRADKEIIVREPLQRIEQVTVGLAMVEQVPVVEGLDDHAEAGPLRVDEIDQRREKSFG